MDEEACQKDPGKLEKVEKQAGEHEREREQRTQGAERVARAAPGVPRRRRGRRGCPPAGTTEGFNEDDEPWADTIANVKRMKAEDREKT